MKKINYYALYKGDTVLTIGTKEELAKYLNVSTRTIEFYGRPCYRKRNKGNCYIVIRIKEGEDDEWNSIDILYNIIWTYYINRYSIYNILYNSFW